MGVCFRMYSRRAKLHLPRLPPRLPERRADALCLLLQTDDSNGDLDPGVLLTAQTITSETTSSTTTTQITKVTDS